MEENYTEFLKSLNMIKEEFEKKLEEAKENLNKINQKRDPKIYEDIDNEVKRRTVELDEICNYIAKFTTNQEEINNADGEKLIEESKIKKEKLQKTREQLSKIDSKKDPKAYQDGEEELKARQEEFEEVSKKIEELDKKIEKLEKLKEIIEKKYNVKKFKEQQAKKSDSKKIEHLKALLIQKRKELKKLSSSIIAGNGEVTIEQKEQIKRLKKEIVHLKRQINEEEKNELKNKNNKNNIEQPQMIDDELQRYGELIKKGYNPESPEMINFYKKIYEERAQKLKNGQEISNIKKSQVTDDELQRYGELIEKGYNPESPEMISFYKKVYEERAQKLKNKQEKDNEKYPLEIVDQNSNEIKNNNIDDKGSADHKNKTIEVDNTNKNNEENSEQIDEENKKRLEIEYNGRSNVYRISNAKDEVKAINFKNKKEKVKYIYEQFTEEEINEIFGSEKGMKKIVRKCDPQLLVLLADNNMDYALEYIDKLTNSKEDAKNELSYKMTYNLKGMRKNRENNDMSLLKRIRVNIMAKKNKNVAEYIPDDKNKGLLGIPLVGLLVAGGLAIAKNQDQDKEQQQNTQQTIDTSDSKTSENVTPGDKKTEDIQPQVSEDVENAIKEDANKYTGDLILGSKATLPDGLTYTEDSLGNGKTAKVGEFSWRPAGDYTIDRVALYYNGKMLENIGKPGSNIDEMVQKYADQLGVDKSKILQKVHVCIADGHNGATGWISMEEMDIDTLKGNISKTYDKVQQEKNNQQQSQNKQQQEKNYSTR